MHRSLLLLESASLVQAEVGEQTSGRIEISDIGKDEHRFLVLGSPLHHKILVLGFLSPKNRNLFSKALNHLAKILQNMILERKLLHCNLWIPRSIITITIHST
jgi:hypothetical protein